MARKMKSESGEPPRTSGGRVGHSIAEMRDAIHRDSAHRAITGVPLTYVYK